jgi:HlyD family secretion protein
MNEYAPPPHPDLSNLGLVPGRRSSPLRRAVFATLVLIGIIAAGAGYFLLGRDAPASYVTSPVARGALVVTVSATGTLQPEDQVDVGAEISGRVDRVTVDYNDKVTRGQVLAIINTDQIRAQLAQAQAELAAANAAIVTSEATVNETRERRDRAEGLFGRGIVSEQDFQTAQADYARAVAAVA